MNKKILLIALAIGAIASTSAVGAIGLSKADDKVAVQKQYQISFISNGGSDVLPIFYINGDDTIEMPKSTRYGYTFSGWYFDDVTFEKPFYPGSSLIDSNISLYAKWTIKSIKIYLDTENENEFEPLIYNVGDTFHVSSLPEIVKDKVANGINFEFSNWLGMDEQVVASDFEIRDTYYAFHAKYGAPKLTSYEREYSNDFTLDCGYIDNNHSWLRGERNLPATGIGQGAPNQDIYKRDENLVLRQLTHNAQGYGAKALLPIEYTQNLRKYSFETTFRIAKQSGLSGDTLGVNDIGFGIMVGYDYLTGANVQAIVDPGLRAVRISAMNKSYAKSSSDVNGSFFYDIPSNVDFSSYHKLKVIYNGEIPSTASNNTASYIEVYFDDNFCWSTKDTVLTKNWFYEDQARGDYAGLTASLCEAEVKSVSLKSFDQNETIYSYDFSSDSNNFADGWRYMDGSNGSNMGEVRIQNGELNINTYFEKQAILKNQVIYCPTSKLKNFSAKFDFKFNKVSAIDKYMGFVFNGNDDGIYNAIFARQGNGQVQLYKHGEASSAYNAWSTATALKTIKGGFGFDYHTINIVLKNSYLIVYLDGEELFSNSIIESKLYDGGLVGFLTSSADVSFDNIDIYNLDKEVK